jgi:phage-related protein
MGPKGATKQPSHLPVPARLLSPWRSASHLLQSARMSPVVKPLLGIGSGVFEIALPFRGNAFRVIYAVQIGIEIWVLHAFQKKSTQGVKTPKHEINLVIDRLKRLKEMLK